MNGIDHFCLELIRSARVEWNRPSGVELIADLNAHKAEHCI
jgi:hypothetical protein